MVMQKARLRPSIATSMKCFELCVPIATFRMFPAKLGKTPREPISAGTQVRTQLKSVPKYFCRIFSLIIRYL